MRVQRFHLHYRLFSDYSLIKLRYGMVIDSRHVIDQITDTELYEQTGCCRIYLRSNPNSSLSTFRCCTLPNKVTRSMLIGFRNTSVLSMAPFEIRNTASIRNYTRISLLIDLLNMH